MNITKTRRGFEVLNHPGYPPSACITGIARQSSAIDDTCDSMPRPGSSFLWIGTDHHLDREEVAQFTKHLQAWLATGSMEVRP